MKLGNEFLHIPKLDISGSNWVIFKDCFIWALNAHGILDHVEGTTTELANLISEEDWTKAKGALTEEQIKLKTEWKKGIREWKQGEAIVKQQIASSIPDSLFMKVWGKGTMHEIWMELRRHFEKRSWMVSINLWWRLQELWCPEKGNIIEHFATMQLMWEDMASMRELITENNFYSIIMGSLPPFYDPYISTVNATSSVLGMTISANDLMLTLTEEYEHCTLKTKGGKKDNNATFYSNNARKDQKGESNLKKNMKCHNCGKKGHYKADCWAEGGGKEGQGLKQKGKEKDKGKDKGKEKEKDSALTAQEKKEEKSKSKEAWMATLSQAKRATDTSFDTAYLTGTNNTEVDLYGLGMTRHMSGFQKKFFNFAEIHPIPIMVAN